MYVDVLRLPSKKNLQTPEAQKFLSKYDIGDNSDEAIESFLSFYYSGALTYVTTQNAVFTTFTSNLRLSSCFSEETL